MLLSLSHKSRSLPLRMALLLAATAVMLLSGCSVFGGASVEEAPYELVRKDKQFEIRDYAPVVVAQTQVVGAASSRKAGNEAFSRLFDYISGENEAQQKIAMTAPVISEVRDNESSEKIAMTAPVMFEKEGDAWRYQFVLPQSYTMETAPRPLNPEVSIARTESRRVATVTYAGLGREAARASNTLALLDWVEAQGLRMLSEPRWAGYNPPWTLPPFRRNEVMVDVSVQ